MGQAPGWYEDLFGREQERYWDGTIWTSFTRPEGSDDAGPFAEVVENDPFAAVSLEAGVNPAKRRGRRRRRQGHRRPRRTVLSVAAVVVIVGALAGVGFYVFGHPEAAATEAVTTAASQSLNAKSVDMLFAMNFSGPGLNEQISGTGAFDFADQTGTMTVNAPVGGQQQSEQIIEDGGMVYISLGDLGSVAPGKSWVSASPGQLSSGGSGGGGGGGGLGGGISQWDDPAGTLQQLQSTGASVTSGGATTYGGTPVTEYLVTVPSSGFQAYLSSLPSSLQQSASEVSMPSLTEKVYVESGGLLRGIDMPYSFGVMGKTFSMDLQMSLTNYGTTVTVTPPPASEVLPYDQFGAIAGNSGNSGNSGSGSAAI